MSTVIQLPSFRYLIEPFGFIEQERVFHSLDKSDPEEPQSNISSDTSDNYDTSTHIRYTNFLTTALDIALNNPYISHVYDQHTSRHILVKRTIS